MNKGMCKVAVWLAAGMLLAGGYGGSARADVDFAGMVQGESAWSAAVRVDCRSDFGGRLVHGTERMGEAEGGAAVAWDTTKLVDGWQEVTKGGVTAEVAVVNASGVAVEYGRLGADAVWGKGKVHVVRDWVVVPDGRVLEVAAGTVVKFTRGAGILVEEGGTLRLSGTEASPVRLTAAEDDAVGGDTDMRAERPVWCYYVDVKGTLEDAGWAECAYVDTAHASGMVAAGLKVGLVGAVTGESVASEAVRVDVRSDFGGRLVHGTERMGDAEGGAAQAWDTTKLADGWQEVTRGDATAEVAVVNASGVAVEYGRFGADAVWGKGKVHVVRDWVVVPDGVTLEIGAGAVVKFTRGTGILVEEGGTLRLSGTAALPVCLTAAEDDAVLGDTDMRAERPVWCHYVDVKGTLEDSGWTECRYVDTAHAAGMVAAGLKVGLVGAVTGESVASGAVRVDCRSDFGGRLVHGTERMGAAEGGAAVAWDTTALADGWQEVAKGDVTAEVAVVNASGVAVEYGRLGADEVWGKGKVHVVRDWVVVPDGRVLEVAAGTVVKFTRGAGILVEEGGTLRLSGTEALPVRLTAAEDDAVGGDTDMRAERPVWCYYVDVKGTLEDAGWTDCQYVDTAHAGSMVEAGLTVGLARAAWSVSGASEETRLDGKAAVDGVLLTEGDEWATWDTAWDGAARIRAVVERPDGAVAELGTAINGGRGSAEWTADEAGRYEVRYEARDGDGKLLRQMARSLVRLGDDVALHAGSVGNAETWVAGKVHVVNGQVTVGSGQTLTIERGAVVKFMPGAALTVESGGSCVAEGVVFTHINDDTAGGDTMDDGAATGPVADDYSVGGNIATDAGTELRWLTMKTSGTLSADTVWMGNRVICVTGNVTVASGATLTVLSGAIVKFNPGVSLTVNSGGTLSAMGTWAQPIVFTSVKDDEFGGDTNGDGDATVAQPGDWTTIKVAGGTARFSHASILYSSRNQTTGAINMTGGTVVFDSGEIAHGLYDAVGVESGNFYMTNSVIRDCLLAFRHWAKDPIVNCVIYDCGRLTQGGGQHFYNCIFSRISEAWEAFGFPQNGTTYNNCCFWNEGGSVLTGEGTQDAMTVCGKNGNIWGNPLFLDAENGDFRVADGSPCVDAGNTAMAPETDYYGQPRASAFGEAVADIGIYEVQPRGVAGDVDLVTVAVSADAEASPGGELRVSWEVGNRGGKMGSGARRDAVSLVSAGGREVALGEKVFTQNVAAGGTAKCEAVFRLPAMAEGTWWPKVVVNSQQDIFEGSLIANNAKTGEVGVDVSVPATAASAGASGTVAAGVPTVLKLHFEAGDGNRMVVLNVPQGVSVAWGFGFVPTEVARSGATVAGETGGSGGSGGTGGSSGEGGTGGTPGENETSIQFLAPESDEELDVYVVLESEVAAEFEIATESGKLAVTSVDPGEVPSSGEATLTVTGAGFMAGSSVKLAGSGATIAAESVRVVDSRTISATVDCGKLAAGAAYDVVVESASGSVTANGAVRVAEAPGKGEFWARLVVPESVREGRKVACSVEYGNSGNADMAAPVIQIAMKGSGSLGYVDGLQGVKTLQFVAAGEEGSAGVLRPGAERRIRFELLAGKDNLLTLHASTDSEIPPKPWESITEYLSDVSSSATRIGLRGQDATDYGLVIDLAKAICRGEATSAIFGRVVQENGEGVKGTVVSFTNTAASVSCLTDATGCFCTTHLPAGVYTVSIPEFLALSSENTVAVDGNVDAPQQLYDVHAGASLSVSVKGVTDESATLMVTSLDNEGGTECVMPWQTDGDTHLFRGLDGGAYSVECCLNTGVRKNQVVFLEEDGGQHLEFDFSGSGTIEIDFGSIDTTDAGFLLYDGVDVDRMVMLNGDTSHIIEGLPVGDYAILFHVRGTNDYNLIAVTVASNFTAVIDVESEIEAGNAGDGAAGTATRTATSTEDGVARSSTDPKTTGAVTTFPPRMILWSGDSVKMEKYARELLAIPIPVPKGEYDCMHNRARQAAKFQHREALENELESFLNVMRWYDGQTMGREFFEEGVREIAWEGFKKWVLGGVEGATHIVAATVFFAADSAKVAYEAYQAGSSGLYPMVEILANAWDREVEILEKNGAIAAKAAVKLTFVNNLMLAASIGKNAGKAVAGINIQMDANWTREEAKQHLTRKCNAYEDILREGYELCCPEGSDIPPFQNWIDKTCPTVPHSVDPNEMSGPLGAGERRLVAPGEWMTYTVYFENKSDATAAAQEVYVTEALGGALDWSTFEMVDVGFNNQLDLGLGGKRKGASETAMTGTAYKVRTELDYSAKTGVANWYMRIVDEVTETRWPRDVYAGFLPPNDATGRGEGHITYRVKLRDDAAAGTVVRASANIVFDYNAAIETDPAWWNTVAEMGTATLDLGNGVETNVTVMVGAPWEGQLPDPGKRQGMRFVGWFTGPNGTGEEVTAESLVAAGAKLYAFWDASAAPELWLDVSWGAVEIGTNGIEKGYGPDGNSVAGIANRYVLTGTSRVHGVKFSGGSFTNTWTNLVIDLNAKDAVAVALDGANVAVEMAGDNSVASGEDCAGIRVDAKSGLVLQGTGRLVARGGKCGAGIGGGKLQDSGRVEVRAGTVDAYGGEYGAGIGGGLVAPAAAAVVITGGSVKARGSDGGEDIGGGFGREETGVPVGAAGTAVHEVEIPLATDTLPTEVFVALGDGQTYHYAGAGHVEDTSLYFWLPDGTYEFTADGDDYAAHVAGTGTAAIFTDPGNTHFVPPPFGEVGTAADGSMRAAMNPAYRTSPFEVWSATGLDDAAWNWSLLPANAYIYDATNAVIRIQNDTNRMRLLRFQFLPRRR